MGSVENISKVYFIPGLKYNILSVGHLMKKGYDICFYDITC